MDRKLVRTFAEFLPFLLFFFCKFRKLETKIKALSILMREGKTFYFIRYTKISYVG